VNRGNWDVRAREKETRNENQHHRREESGLKCGDLKLRKRGGKAGGGGAGMVIDVCRKPRGGGRKICSVNMKMPLKGRERLVN